MDYMYYTATDFLESLLLAFTVPWWTTGGVRREILLLLATYLTFVNG